MIRAEADSSEMLLSRFGNGYLRAKTACAEERLLELLPAAVDSGKYGRRAAAAATGGPAAEVRKTRVEVDTKW